MNFDVSCHGYQNKLIANTSLPIIRYIWSPWQNFKAEGQYGCPLQTTKFLLKLPSLRISARLLEAAHVISVESSIQLTLAPPASSINRILIN